MASSRPLVLVGFVESLAAIESIWNLLDHGFDVHGFTRSGRQPAIARDHRVVVTHVTAPEQDLEATVREVVELAGWLQWPLLMPLDDTGLLVLDKVSSADAQAVVAGPTGKAARLCLDKRLQLQEAATADLSVPPTLVVEAGTPTPPPTWAPPWIVKPALALDVVDGRLTKGAATFASNSSELARALNGRNDCVLVQPRIDGVGHGVFGLARRGSSTQLSGHQRVRMMNPSGSGSSACRSADPTPELLEGVERFVSATVWDGLFMMEFLMDDRGVPWFMELNGRTWGSMALAVRRGLDYPAWTAATARDLGFEVPDTRAGDHVTARHLGRELLHLAFVARGRHNVRRSARRGEAPRPDLAAYPTLPATARSVLTWHRGERLYNARRGHLDVLTADTVSSILGVVRARGDR